MANMKLDVFQQRKSSWLYPERCAKLPSFQQTANPHYRVGLRY